MKKVALYSSSSRSRTAARPSPARASGAPAVAPGERPPAPAADRPSRFAGWRFVAHRERPLLVLAGALLALALVLGHGAMKAPQREITQDDIVGAVRHVLETETMPSPAVKAYEAILPSVVRVRGMAKDENGDEVEMSVGSGVVIVDKGVILTNLHVVSGAEVLKVVFADGLESEAIVTGLRPEHDLAVIQAKTIPDDLVAANLRSTANLAQGEQVIAVGFPFGIGPSVSAGVVSGLRREFHSPEGKRMLTNLIQFDAAANPGNSGGPLVTMDGEVVGIVTGILNPTDQRVHIGIGFAVPIENAAAAAGLSPF